MNRIYYKDKNDKTLSFANDKEFKMHLKIHGAGNNFTKLSDIQEVKDIQEASKTTKQRILETRNRYDQEIQKVCTEHLFNDINSARNLSTLETSPLQPIAKKITNWELEQQAIFVKLLNDVENDIITIDKNTFDDNFIKFNKDT